MSTKLGCGEKGTDWKVNDYFRVAPENLIIREDLRGRFLPPSDRDVMNLAISMHLYGQLQPAVVRLMDLSGKKNVPVLTAGFTRCNAARLLRKGFIVPADFSEKELKVPEGEKAKGKFVVPGETIQDPEFMLSVVPVRGNDQEAFERNIEENQVRNNCSDIDDAHNQEVLRSKYGYTDADIARKYRYKNQQKVARLARLLQLPEDIQLLIHTGKLATTAALDLLDAPQDQWARILEAATDGGKIKGSLIRSAVRDAGLADFADEEEMQAGLAAGEHPAIAAPADEDDTETEDVETITNAVKSTASKKDENEPAKAKARSVAELRKFIKTRVEDDATTDPAIAAFLTTLGKWIAGKRNDKSLDKALKTLAASGVAAGLE